MKISVISDIHENFHNLILSLTKMNEQKVDYIICLGDLMNAGIAKVIAMQEIPAFFIWGNNDGDKVAIINAANSEGSNLKWSDNTYDFLELGGKKLFLTHYNNLALPMAKSGEYDAVFYGHNHLKKVEKIDGVHVVNPGELAAQKTGEATFAIYDTESNEVEIVSLEGTVTLKSELVDQYFRDNMDKLDFRSKASFSYDK